MARGSRAMQQRRLRTELRHLRELAGHTQKHIAESLGWSVSKVIRIETGAVHASTADVRALLHFYEIDDQVRTKELVAITQAKDEVWWDEYRPYFKQHLMEFVDYEDSATRIRLFSGVVVPGLLQTEEYIRALFEHYRGDKEVFERSVHVRMRRQQVLEAEGGRHAWFVIDEAALHRRIGGSDVARRQLIHLKEMAKQPNIGIQVVPFTAGVHAGLRGDFTVLEFPSEEEGFLLYVESPHRGEIIRDDAGTTSQFVEFFYALEEIATPPDELDKFLDPLIDDMRDDT